MNRFIEISINAVLEEYFFVHIDEGDLFEDTPLKRHIDGKQDISKQVQKSMRLTSIETQDVIEGACKDLGLVGQGVSL